MNFSFIKQIWSNNEQRFVGISCGTIEISDSDLQKLKEVYEYFLSIKLPSCGWSSDLPIIEKRKHYDCEHCNGGKPHLEWSHAEHQIKNFLNQKYIHQLSSLALCDISIIFPSYKKYYEKEAQN